MTLGFPHHTLYIVTKLSIQIISIIRKEQITESSTYIQLIKTTTRKFKPASYLNPHIAKMDKLEHLLQEIDQELYQTTVIDPSIISLVLPGYLLIFLIIAINDVLDVDDDDEDGHHRTPFQVLQFFSSLAAQVGSLYLMTLSLFAATSTGEIRYGFLWIGKNSWLTFADTIFISFALGVVYLSRRAPGLLDELFMDCCRFTFFALRCVWRHGIVAPVKRMWNGLLVLVGFLTWRENTNNAVARSTRTGRNSS